MTLVLASGSETRAKMLRDAGVDIEVIPSTVDEAPLKIALSAEGRTSAEMANGLAESKASEVAARMPGGLVLGADQILVFGEKTFDKPRDLREARAQMQNLRGEKHTLVSAAVLARDDVILWRGEASATLTMRDFSDVFLDEYLKDVGNAVLWSVGGYQIEGRGAQLFDRIEGDYFSILGLPLIAVLAALRREGVMTE